ncbi:MAG TPA: ribonuclease HI [Gammaproteobacteria bacterium]|nr:ribonuclease HI [Gammaproteobacteria bacterium]
MQYNVVVYTDGACSGNPGRGGWGCVLFYNDRCKELCGGEDDTTNNRMELMATIKALEALKMTCKVKLYTDSTYVQKGITDWIYKWKKNNWKKSDKKPVVNVDLWQRLDKLRDNQEVEWLWVKGHSGHQWNDRADALAQMGVRGKELK